MLLEEILSRPNMLAAYDRVTGNKGAAGIDGIEAKDFKAQLDRKWVQIKSQLENGSYQPQAVKRVTIPMPNGEEHHLGIPTVTDRIAQMIVTMTLEPELDAIAA